jgi:hypothetical protein
MLLASTVASELLPLLLLLPLVLLLPSALATTDESA